ncbi:MAG: UDP-galactopyranose mutase [Chthoniobacterales bacterium]|nr:MAG: UDP-galactopyranose mutase [Chthoniobacterales bacterium]
MERYDYLIVGAGFSGLVMAERLSSQLGQRCLIVEKRAHIGGNSHDEYDAAGVLIHSYGPHYFRSNSSKVVEYLSQFTEWRQVPYRILSFTEGKYWSFPINLQTFEQLLARPSTTEEMEQTLRKWRVPISNPSNSEEVIVSQVGRELYEKFFRNYTRKQWGRPATELDASVCGRIPIRTNRDDRYLSEKFQALPAAGYHRLFQKLLAATPNVSVMLRTNYREVLSQVEFKHMIFTGPVDEFFDYRLGRLPYRSLSFQPESFSPEALKDRESIAGKKGFWQPAMQVNYPNDFDFTRIVEIKHATGQETENTTIVREYPRPGGPDAEPYYPIPAPESAALYQRYRELAEAEKKVSFIGRLATYRYCNMDQAVAMALAEFERLRDATVA